MRTKLAIVGFAQSTMLKAPFKDPDFEIWGMNHLYPYIPAWTRWFEVHDPGWMKANFKPWDKHEKWLKEQHEFPIYMQQEYPEYPASMRFPLDEIAERFGSRYLTSSVALMLAFALYEGKFKEIHIYGVDMTHDTEHEIQRPCTEFWLGVATGLGVKVVIPEESALLKSEGVYGYEYSATSPVLREVMEALEKEAARLEADYNKAVGYSQSYDGALQVIKDFQARVRERQRGKAL